MEAQTLEHKEKFSGERLAALFRNTPYLVEKVMEGVVGDESGPARAALASLAGCLDMFRGSLVRRSGHYSDHPMLQTEVPRAQKAIDRLLRFFADRSSQDADDAYMFSHFLKGAVENFALAASQIDQEYTTLAVLEPRTEPGPSAPARGEAHKQ